MFIYLDTVLWNRLCDQGVDARRLAGDLAKDGAMLVLGTEAVYEMARTFYGKKSGAHERGERLFSYLRAFVGLRISCLQTTPNILADEAHIAQGSRKEGPQVFVNEQQYAGLENEVEKLSRGVVDSRADELLRKRKAEAESVRSDIAAYYQDERTAHLLTRTAGVSVDGLSSWIKKELPRSGRRVLRGHLARVFPGSQVRELTWIAKKLLGSNRYPIAHALTRADLYTNWRFSQSGSMPRDLPSDTYHIVNAAYCDIYATSEEAQARYAPLVLTKTKVALYGGDVAVSFWLTQISRERRGP